jgi:hypothetical protein
MDTQFRDLHVFGNKAYVTYEINMLCPHCDCFSTAQGVQIGRIYYLFACLQCRESVYIYARGDPSRAPIDMPEIVDYYPKRKVTVDPVVPPEMACDFLEAQRCFSVAAWQACSVMARRCIHLVVEHFHAVGTDLYKQIEDLKKKQLITPVLADAAQRVRALGKHGAHPYDAKGNPFNELEMEDARSALEFCEFIFDQVFVQPAKIQISQGKIR